MRNNVVASLKLIVKQQVGNTTSTHFAKQELEPKHNSFHSKGFKVQKNTL
jgi:hypothetical protein